MYLDFLPNINKMIKDAISDGQIVLITRITRKAKNKLTQKMMLAKAGNLKLVNNTFEIT